MAQAGVLEPQLLKDRCLTSALEATSMILRADDVIRSKTPDPNHDIDDHGHGPDGEGHMRRSTGGYPWAIGH